MEYVYAALILHETSTEINESNLTAVLEAAGEDVITSRVKAIVASLEGVDIAAADVPTGNSETADGELSETDPGAGADIDLSSMTGASSDADPFDVPSGESEAGSAGADDTGDEAGDDTGEVDEANNDSAAGEPDTDHTEA